jgi:hypothetical protein
LIDADPFSSVALPVTLPAPPSPKKCRRPRSVCHVPQPRGTATSSQKVIAMGQLVAVSPVVALPIDRAAMSLAVFV